MRDPGLLPHAYPFRFLTAGSDTEVAFAVSANDSWSRGGALPPWVLLEAMTQATGILLGDKEKPGGFAVQVQRYKAPRPVLPGDRLVFSSTLIKRMGPVFQGRTVARKNGRICAAGTFTIREVAP
jgi:hypothetical protein